MRFFMHGVTNYLSSQKDSCPDVASLCSLMDTAAKKQVLTSRFACCDAVAIAEGPDVFVQHLKHMVQNGPAVWSHAKVSDELSKFEQELGLLDETDHDGKTADAHQIKKEAVSPVGPGKGTGASGTMTGEANRWMSFHDVTAMSDISPAESIADLHTFRLHLEKLIFLYATAKHEETGIYKRLDFDLVGKKNIRLREASFDDKLFFMGSVVFGKKPKVIAK